jgi:hypothetical protein
MRLQLGFHMFRDEERIHMAGLFGRFSRHFTNRFTGSHTSDSLPPEEELEATEPQHSLLFRCSGTFYHRVDSGDYTPLTGEGSAILELRQLTEGKRIAVNLCVLDKRGNELLLSQPITEGGNMTVGW